MTKYSGEPPETRRFRDPRAPPRSGRRACSLTRPQQLRRRRPPRRAPPHCPTLAASFTSDHSVAHLYILRRDTFFLSFSLSLCYVVERYRTMRHGAMSGAVEERETGRAKVSEHIRVGGDLGQMAQQNGGPAQPPSRPARIGKPYMRGHFSTICQDLFLHLCSVPGRDLISKVSISLTPGDPPEQSSGFRASAKRHGFAAVGGAHTPSF